ncbi:MAG: methyl-accepting chemotaxis protein [Treponema sp.]|nr:methyl-accepting chemotaxis protein [Treponema sp.]
MSKRHRSLSIQILGLCIFLVIAIAAAVSVIFTININRLTEENLRTQARATMQYLDADLYQTLTPFINMIQSGSAFFNELPSQQAAEAVFTRIMEVYPDVLDLYYGSVTSMYLPGGAWISADEWYPETDPDWDFEWDPPERPWHMAAMANPDKLMLIDPYVDAQTKKLVVTFCQTVRNNDGIITGVIAVDVMVDRLSDIVVGEKITPDGTTYLIDKDGLFVVHPDESYVLEKNLFEEMPSIDKAAVLGNEIDVVFQDNNYFSSAPVQGTEWFLVSTGSLASMEAVVNRLILFVIFVVLGITVLTALIALVLTYRLTRPFEKLASSFDVISKGDLTVTTPDYASKEASSLSNGFNQFTESISSMIKMIKDSAGYIKKVAEDLTLSIANTDKTITMVKEGVASIKNDVSRENESIIKSESAINLVMEEINNLNEKIRKQSTEISGSSSAIEEMVASIHSIESSIMTVNSHMIELVASSLEEKKRISAATEAAKMVERESEALAEMNEVISNIATRTNLLSMNAAIEAAHAGEAGKGFAVVAQEIRKLAENTAQQTKGSGEALLSIQKQIREIADSSAHVEQSFEGMIGIIKGIEQLSATLKTAAEEQSVGSRQLLESIAVINTITSDVETGASAMQSSAGEAVSACQSLTEISRNVSDIVEKCAHGVSVLTEESKSVLFAAENTRDGVEALEQEVNHFMVK